MPDICDLILDDHERFRRSFADLDDLRRAGTSDDAFGRAWQSLADLLELHAAAEEALFYPKLLRRGDDAEAETQDAISDHNEIRDAIRRAVGATVGGDDWWQAVLDARVANSDHLAEEERGALADFRVNAEGGLREELGDRWLRYRAEHAGARGLALADEDPDRFIAEHR